MSQRDQLKLQMIEIGRRLYDRGHLVATSGNISARLPDGNILITASQKRKYNLHDDDLSTITQGGELIEGNRQQSSEFKVHLALYRSRSDIKAVVHAHSPYAITCSLSKTRFDVPFLPEIALTLGKIPVIPYIKPGSHELAEAVAKESANCNAFIMERHGVVAVGNDLDEAFDRLETVEHAAKIAYLLSLKGKIPVLGKKELAELVISSEK